MFNQGTVNRGTHLPHGSDTVTLPGENRELITSWLVFSHNGANIGQCRVSGEQANLESAIDAITSVASSNDVVVTADETANREISVERPRVAHSLFAITNSFVKVKNMMEFKSKDCDTTVFDILEEAADALDGRKLHLSADGDDLEIRQFNILKDFEQSNLFSVEPRSSLAKRVHSLCNIPSRSPNGDELVWTDFDVKFVERELWTEENKAFDGVVDVLLPVAVGRKLGFSEDTEVSMQPRCLNDAGFIKGYGNVILTDEVERPTVHTTSDNLKTELKSSNPDGHVLFMLINVNGNLESQVNKRNGKYSTSVAVAELCQLLGFASTEEAAREVLTNKNAISLALEASISAKASRILDLFNKGELWSYLDSIEAESAEDLSWVAAIMGAMDVHNVSGTISTDQVDRAAAAVKLRKAGLNPNAVSALCRMVENVVLNFVGHTTSGWMLDKDGKYRPGVSQHNKKRGYDEAKAKRDAKKSAKKLGLDVVGTNLKITPMAWRMNQNMADGVFKKLAKKITVVRKGFSHIVWDENQGHLVLIAKNDSGLQDHVIEFLDSFYIPGQPEGNLWVSHRHCVVGSLFRETLGGADFDGDGVSIRSHCGGKYYSVVRHPIGPKEVFRIEKSNCFFNIRRDGGFMELPDYSWDADGKIDTKHYETDRSVQMKAEPASDVDGLIDQRMLAFLAMKRHGVNLGTIVNNVYAQFWYSGAPEVLHNESFIDAFIGLSLDEDQVLVLAKWLQDHKVKDMCKMGKMLYQGRSSDHPWGVLTLLHEEKFKHVTDAKKMLDEKIFSKPALMQNRMEMVEEIPQLKDTVNKLCSQLSSKYPFAEPKHWIASQKTLCEAFGEQGLGDAASRMGAVLVLTAVAIDKQLDDESLEKFWCFLTDSNPCYKAFKLSEVVTMNGDHPAIVGMVELATHYRK